MKRDSAMYRALDYLNRFPDSPADLVGGAALPGRTGRRCSVNGGGDYAAQMLLGRLRKRGWARTTNSVGSSRWGITTSGRATLKAAT